MKSATEVFLEYAAAFEETYIDDDWSRLERFFAPDAVYEVRGGPMACSLKGTQAIFAGLKKSLDGMDRRSDDRKIEITGEPELRTNDLGEVISIGWHASYRYGDTPKTGFAGRSSATVANGVIVAMHDEYTDEAMDQFSNWIVEHKVDIDGSYV